MSAQPFRGQEPIVCEKRRDDGQLNFSPPQPPKTSTTLDEVYQWFFRDQPSANGNWDELRVWLDERDWKLRRKTW